MHHFRLRGTGGFGIKNDSMGSYSTYCQIITTIFMIAFGVNFSAYYLILKKKFRQAFAIEEVRCYLGIIAAAIVIIAINTRHLFSGIGTAVQQPLFRWAPLSPPPAIPARTLISAVFIQGCSGSSDVYRGLCRQYGGGIKVSRILLLCKAQGKNFSVISIQFRKETENGRQTCISRNAALHQYFPQRVSDHFCRLHTDRGYDNFDLVSTFTAVATTLNNIGPGLEVAGPLGNFSSFSYLSKSVMIFDMLAGRLEIFPLLLLFCRGYLEKILTIRLSSQFFKMLITVSSHLYCIFLYVESDKLSIQIFSFSYAPVRKYRLLPFMGIFPHKKGRNPEDSGPDLIIEGCR